MAKNIFCKISIIGAISILSSCNSQLNTANGSWIQDETTMMIKNETLQLLYNYDIPEAFYSLSTNSSLLPLHNRMKTSKMDKFCKEILNNIAFNFETDTVYFSFSGYLTVYSSPSLDMDKVDFLTELKQVPENFRKEYMNPMPDTNNKFFQGKEYLFRTIYFQKNKKRYIIKDSYKKNNHYMNWVYAFQVLKRKKPYTITWIDITNPAYVNNAGQLLRKAKIITLINLKRDLPDIIK